MQEYKQLAPALRRRIGDQRVPFRQLVAEFGQYVAPETAIRTYTREKPAASTMVEFTQDQKLSIGRQYALVGALHRIGAKFEGPRFGFTDRVYYLPESARVATSYSPFIKLPTVPEALAHLRERESQLKDEKARSWNQADRQAMTVLVQLAEACEKQGLSQDIMDAAPPVQVIPPTPTEAVARNSHWPPFLSSKHGREG